MVAGSNVREPLPDVEADPDPRREYRVNRWIVWERIRATAGDAVSGVVQTGQLSHDEAKVSEISL